MLRDGNTVKLYVIEEQELYRNLFYSLFGNGDGQSASLVRLVGMPGAGDPGSLRQVMESLSPDVVLCSAKRLGGAMGLLTDIQENYPTMGIVLLFMQHSPDEIERLRTLAVRSKSGMAFFLKQSLDMTSQLNGIIAAVARGEFIIDPLLAAQLFMGKTMIPFLNQITKREMEILSLIAKGYSNAAIGEALYIDVKTVERHINNMYSKLKVNSDFDNKHSRVSAARLYLEATG